MLDKALPISLNYDHHPLNVQQTITEKIASFYFKNKQLAPENHQNLTNVNMISLYFVTQTFILHARRDLLFVFFFLPLIFLIPFFGP